MNIDKIQIQMELLNKVTGIPITILSNKNKILYNTFGLKNAKEISIYPFIEKKEPNFTTPEIFSYNAIELYSSFSFHHEGSVCFALIGPVLTVRPVSTENLQNLSFGSMHDEDLTRRFIQMIPVQTIPNLIHFTQTVFFSITEQVVSFEDINHNRVQYESENFKEKLGFLASEDKPYEDDIYSIYAEMTKIYEAVGSADILKVKTLLENNVLISFIKRMDQKLNLYYVISSSTLLSKAAIESGVDYHVAKSFALTLVNYAETCVTPDDFVFVTKKMVFGFANLVNELKSELRYSKTVNKAIQYIDKHLHYPITLEEVASHVHLSRPYISQLFSKEVQISLQNFVQIRKIEEAKNLLAYTKISIAEIAEILAFCSQSYFTEIFKKVTDKTPVQYRKENRFK